MASLIDAMFAHLTEILLLSEILFYLIGKKVQPMNDSALALLPTGMSERPSSGF
jgi:hypothetical protein